MLLLSTGGAHEKPYAVDSVYYGQRVAWWATELGLDGVDFDLENAEVGAWSRGLGAPRACGVRINALPRSDPVAPPSGTLRRFHVQGCQLNWRSTRALVD